MVPYQIRNSIHRKRMYGVLRKSMRRVVRCRYHRYRHGISLGLRNGSTWSRLLSPATMPPAKSLNSKSKTCLPRSPAAFRRRWHQWHVQCRQLDGAEGTAQGRSLSSFMHGRRRHGAADANWHPQDRRRPDRHRRADRLRHRRYRRHRRGRLSRCATRARAASRPSSFPAV
jgi:hypothetical protein